MGAPAVVGERLGVIAGSGVPDEVLDAGDERQVATDRGVVTVVDTAHAVWLRRHGRSHRPPHLVDHRANLAALAGVGCDRVLAVASVGTLRTDWPVGTVLAPDDFFAPQVNPSYHDDAAGHRVPGFDPAWRRRVLASWAASTDTPLHDGGTYAQTTGPRFETPAEIRFLATVADVVGMTLAAEVVLAGEIGLAFAAVCVVDNLANGLDAGHLTVEDFSAGVLANRGRLAADLAAVVPALSKTGA